MSELLALREVSKSFGGVRALNKLDLTIDSDGITGLIGPNGSGKTTVFNVISGLVRPDEGRITFLAELVTAKRADVVARLGIRRTFQVPRVARALTVMENLMLAIEDQPSGSLVALFDPMRRRRVAAGNRLAIARAFEMAEIVGLESSADRAAGTLSGGQLKLLSLGIALLGRPRLLLLDEPMAGVNRVLVQRIGDILRARHHDEGLPMVLIEHDLAVVEALCKRVIVLDNGRVIADGSVAEIRDDAQVKSAYLGKRAIVESE
jgi:ABC-type branched-subunit amino acid transport system ATPase component